MSGLNPETRQKRIEEYEQAIVNLGDEELLFDMITHGLRTLRYENTRLPIPPGPNELRGTMTGVLVEELRRAKILLDPSDR